MFDTSSSPGLLSPQGEEEEDEEGLQGGEEGVGLEGEGRREEEGEVEEEGEAAEETTLDSLNSLLN